MQLLEEYEELIERDSAQISVLWKITQIFLYFLSTISGYCCAIIFYILWVDIFGGHCPLWAHAYMIPKVKIIDPNNDDCENPETMTKDIEIDHENWLNYIIVRYDYESNCKVYYFVSLCSCIFGIVWIALFSVCGKGGYDTRIITAPWRIVMPALSFNLIFTIVSMYAAHDLQAGFTKFKFDIQKLFSEITEDNKPASSQMICDVLQQYVEMYNVNGHDTCSLFVVLEISTWLMAWSWTIGLIILMIRVLIVVDFRLLKIMIYEIPYNSVTSLSNTNIDSTSIQLESKKEKQN
ncbi:hypothetical protein KPH14_005779 [Odynerus spinipes]|uniref:Uncharacterized protein n=1 Tax=Odynerus spinipes TaxID=1348599 RepID=A0AAD9RB35_9HYME|nr:hypothetical protein KPH14_005779 [Odynerus spinipes]